MSDADENIIGETLTPKQEAFCRFYTQNDELFGNATLSYAEAYGFDIDAQPDNDAIYRLRDGREVPKYLYEDLPNKETDGAKKIKESSRHTMYSLCSSYGSRMRRNDKVQARCRVLMNEFLRNDVIDSRLIEIVMKGEAKDSIQAIKEFNKLKQRIVEKKDITSGGEKIAGFNFIRADVTSGYSDARTPEEREQDSKITSVTTVSDPPAIPEPIIIRNGEDNSNDKTNS